MNTFLVILFIPIFCIGLTVYIMSLFDFIIGNNLNFAILLISLLVSIISIFIILNNYFEYNKSSRSYKYKLNMQVINSYISFILLFLFGISLILNVILNKMNYVSLIMGIFIIILFVYITYMLIINKKVVIFKLQSIDKLDKNIYQLTFINSKYGLKEYYVDNNKYKVNKSYKCLYNISSKRIIKLLNEVIDMEDYNE